MTRLEAIIEKINSVLSENRDRPIIDSPTDHLRDPKVREIDIAAPLLKDAALKYLEKLRNKNRGKK